ncbi:hypothetical protein M426DRAFT_208061 [Hypoxylon sp. CI-4A]|nr:hypothetical protein M426DRAFT_208061 [Hypoxylon sp. CI-4A]
MKSYAFFISLAAFAVTASPTKRNNGGCTPYVICHGNLAYDMPYCCMGNYPCYRPMEVPTSDEDFQRICQREYSGTDASCCFVCYMRLYEVISTLIGCLGYRRLYSC